MSTPPAGDDWLKKLQAQAESQAEPPYFMLSPGAKSKRRLELASTVQRTRPGYNDQAATRQRTLHGLGAEEAATMSREEFEQWAAGVVAQAEMSDDGSFEQFARQVEQHDKKAAALLRKNLAAFTALAQHLKQGLG